MLTRSSFTPVPGSGVQSTHIETTFVVVRKFPTSLKEHRGKLFVLDRGNESQLWSDCQYFALWKLEPRVLVRSKGDHCLGHIVQAFLCPKTCSMRETRK